MNYKRLWGWWWLLEAQICTGAKRGPSAGSFPSLTFYLWFIFLAKGCLKLRGLSQVKSQHILEKITNSLALL